jgi:hypothetical protein
MKNIQVILYTLALVVVIAGAIVINTEQASAIPALCGTGPFTCSPVQVPCGTMCKSSLQGPMVYVFPYRDCPNQDPEIPSYCVY